MQCSRRIRLSYQGSPGRHAIGGRYVHKWKEDIVDLKSEQRGAARGTMAALIVCAAGLALGDAILPRWFHFPVDLPARLAFALRADLFVLLWVVLGIVLVALGRGRSAAGIGGAAFSRQARRSPSGSRFCRTRWSRL
jgi:hypothetical protein